ncbi:MAG: tyrosine--tRNA ligase [Spirochaetota bacterium]|nr:tyrosine--tRNA ligase [Spirochaetota bacterium]
MSGALEELEKRGFIQQCSDLEGLRETMKNEVVSFYVGVDPTARSLHIGHMVPFYALAHIQRHGHRPILVVGGGTGMIGDPSGKTEMRKILSIEDIRRNEEGIKYGASKLIDFSEGKALMVNNYDWLGDLNYIEFLRDIGRHFSVNRMLSFEAYKQRLEKGLSFIEFNYMLLQSYDFLILNREYDCKVQVGGDDQWGNILSGVELIRRMDGNEAYALTFPLVTRSDGKKMGKSEHGAIFLDPELCSPYEFYQYWRNVNDADVIRFLKMFTFLELEEIEELAKLEGQDINKAKERLAYEQTVLIHGEEEARKAVEASRAAFAGEGQANNRDAIPSLELSADTLEKGINVLDLFAMTSLCSSKGEARRLVTQGGARVNDEKIEDIEAVIDGSSAEEGELLLRAGKKRYFRIIVKE